MSAIAWDLFGKTPETWERVQAVVDWVHRNVTFGYQFSRHDQDRVRRLHERQGVCRDFQHLTITFPARAEHPGRTRPATWGTSACRRIRTRWTLGLARGLLGDRWHTIDARHNEPRIGRVLMAAAATRSMWPSPPRSAAPPSPASWCM